MSDRAQRKKFFTMRSQLKALIVIAAVITAVAVILIVLSHDPLYKNEKTKGLYDASAEIAAAKEKLGGVKSELIEKSGGKAFKTSLVFEGVVAPEVTERIIALLKSYDMDAVFCASAINAVENADSLNMIKAAGYEIACYNMNGETHVDRLSTDEMLYAFCTSASYIKQATGEQPKLLRCRNTKCTDALLKAAFAAGYTNVIDAKCEVGLKSFSSFSSVSRYINDQAQGAIIAFRLTAEKEESEQTPAGETAAAPDITPAVETTAAPKLTPTLTGHVMAPAAEHTAIPKADMTPSPSPQMHASALPSLSPTMAPTPAPTPEAEPTPDASGIVKHDEDWVDMAELTELERAELIATWLIKANAEAEYCAEADELREKNSGRTAPLQRTVYTTKRGVCLLFGGLKKNDAELSALLAKLKELGAVATFAVTYDEAKNCEGAIKAVIQAGHAVEAAVRPKEGSDYYQLFSQLYLCRQYLAEHYSLKLGALMVTLGSLDLPVMAEAASAAGVEQIGYHSAASQAEADRSLSAAQIMGKLFSNDQACLQRGHIFYFPLNNYTNSSTVSELVERVFLERNIYPAYTLKELLDKELIYTYPVGAELWQEGIADVRPGHITDESALMDLIASRYLGCTNASSIENLPGFSDDERGRLNKDGLLDTKDRAVCLTFDDWGTDRDIDPLLEVLKAHSVNGTFFIRTNHVDANPNLLRAIVADGNEVGTHTHEHRPLSDMIGDTMVYESLTEAEANALEEDIYLSWKTLAGVIGDMEVNGRSALIKILRPPTLAVSKLGLRSAFDLGLEYVASGSYSTHDYEAESAQALYEDIIEHLRPGAVLVLHMSAQAKNTPEALDMLFNYNESLPENESYTFALLGDYLDGTIDVKHPY